MNHTYQHKILYRERRFHAAFPGIARFSDGNLLLAFRRARDAGWLIPLEKRGSLDPFARMDHIDSRSQIVLLELDPTGQNQVGTEDILPMDPEAGDQDASVIILPGDNLLLASFSWYPLPADAACYLPGRVSPGDASDYPGCRFLLWGSHSSLRGRTPGSWRHHHCYLGPDGEYQGKVIDPDGDKIITGATRGSLLVYQDKVLLGVYGGSESGCSLFGSPDQGRCWNYLGSIARDPAGKIRYQEPALCHNGNGGVRCFMRTAGAGGRLAVTDSPDGKHWQEPVLHDLVGHPFHPLHLSDGRLLLTYGYRQEPYGIRARLLNSPADNPDDYPEIILRDDGPCRDVGYPWSVELSDGRVLVVYYMTDQEGLRHIAGTWLEI